MHMLSHICVSCFLTSVCLHTQGLMAEMQTVLQDQDFMTEVLAFCRCVCACVCVRVCVCVCMCVCVQCAYM